MSNIQQSGRLGYVPFPTKHRVLFNTDTVTEGGVSAAPAAAPVAAPAANPTPQTPSGNNGAIPLAIHEEKVAGLHRDLSKERTEIKKLREENEGYKSRESAYLLKEKKATAYDTALAGLGEDFEILADKVPGLKATIEALSDREDLDTVIATLVGLAKSAKAKPDPANAGFLEGNPPADGGKDKKYEFGKLPSLSEVLK